MEKFIGDMVCIEFLDHVGSECNETGAMVCKVYGEIHEVKKDWVRLRTWHSVNCTEGTNDDFVVIVRQSIKRVQLLGTIKELPI